MGDVDFCKVESHIKSTFAVGEESESTSFKYIGLEIEKNESGLALSQHAYCQDISEIVIPCRIAKDMKLTDKEITLLRSLAGQINWAATQSRPDIAFSNCVVSSGIRHATYDNILTANKTVRAVHAHSVKLCFSKLNMSNGINLIAFSDASFANLPDEGSQGAMLVFMIDCDGRYSLLSWQSRRIHRVVNSTLSAELLAAVDAFNTCVYLKAILCDILCSDIKISISILTDNKSITDSIHSTTLAKLENKRLRVDFALLRDSLKRGELDEIRWVPDDLQIANCLTKKGASVTHLLDVLSGNLRFDYSSGAFV